MSLDEIVSALSFAVLIIVVTNCVGSLISMHETAYSEAILSEVAKELALKIAYNITTGNNISWPSKKEGVTVSIIIYDYKEGKLSKEVVYSDSSFNNLEPKAMCILFVVSNDRLVKIVAKVYGGCRS